MQRGLFKLIVAIAGLIACVGGLTAQTPEEPVRPLPPPPMPMAGRVFPVYPLYPAYGAVPIVYAKETFAAADATGYFLYAAPANYWSVSTHGWRWVPHPQAAEIATRFTAPALVAPESGADALFDIGGWAYLSGDYHRAREYLEAATAKDPRDARAWQYLALTRWVQGENEAGRQAARHATAAALLYPEKNAAYRATLDRIQGPTRERMTEAAGDITTVQQAEAVLTPGG
jgi:predicted Zn-dependent protease